MISNLIKPALPVDPTATRQTQEWKHDRPLISCRFDPSGRFVFAGAEDNDVQRWEVATGTKSTLVGHASWVKTFAFLPGRGRVYSVAYEGRVNGWPMGDESPAPEWSFEAHKGWVRTASVSPDGQLLATGGNDNCIRLWATADGKLRRELLHDCHVYNTAFDPTGQHLVSADHKGLVKHWDPETGRLIRTLDAGLLYKYDTGFRAGCGGARGMAFSPDGRYLACSGITDVTNAFAGVGNAVVVLFDWLTGQQKGVLRPKEEFQGVAWDVAFHPNGFLIAVGGGGGGGALWFWRPEEERSFHALKLPNNGRGFDMHPAGQLLAVAHADNTLRLYDMSPNGE